VVENIQVALVVRRNKARYSSRVTARDRELKE